MRETELQQGVPRLPTIAEAHELLRQAGERNPGLWLDHSRVAARAAQSIAARHPGLELDRAYVLALLHDLGRRAGGPGVPDVRHIMDGYRLLEERGFRECARICLTHSFPIKQVDAFASNWDCPREEREFVQHYLDSTDYTTYDQLVQLCDALALPSGPCLIEKRLVDVALRHGFNPLTLSKWQAFFSLEREFRTALGAPIYTVLPGVVRTPEPAHPSDREISSFASHATSQAAKSSSSRPHACSIEIRALRPRCAVSAHVAVCSSVANGRNWCTMIQACSG